MRCPRDIPQPLLLRGENCNLCISAIDLGKGFVFAKKSLQHCAQPRCHSRSTMGLNQAKTGNILPYCGRFDRIQKSLRIAIVAVLRLSSHAFPGRLLWRQRRLRQSPAIASPQNLWGHYGGNRWQNLALFCRFDQIQKSTGIALFGVLRLFLHASPGSLLWRLRRLRQSLATLARVEPPSRVLIVVN